MNLKYNIMGAEDFNCILCGARAAKLHPDSESGEVPHPYCKSCLNAMMADNAKKELEEVYCTWEN